MTSTTVAVRQVSRRFGVSALTNLRRVPTGAITVLLGPNGLKQTTAIRMITGALGPDSGTVEVFGTDPSGADGLGPPPLRSCRRSPRSTTASMAGTT